MKPRYFLGACIFAIGVLLPLGAPVETVAAGIMLAGLFGIIRPKPKGVAR